MKAGYAERIRSERIAEHEASKDEERRQQTIRDMANHDARKKYLDGLEAKKAEEKRIHDAELDKEFEARKAVLKREWLLNHPSETPASFEQKAWPLLRENLIAERTEAVRIVSAAEARENLSGRLAL